MAERDEIAALEELLPKGFGEKLTELWLAPIRKQMVIAGNCRNKGLGELTVPEAMAWFYCLGYGALTGYIIGKAAANLLEVALGGRQ